MKRGFSLVEMLTVVLILIVLLSLLVPVLSKSKGSANKVVCASNMHQIYLAMKLYENDHGEYPPNSVTFAAFQPYYPVVLMCPSSIHKSEPNLRKADYQMLGTPIGHTYPLSAEAYNAFLQCRQARGALMPLVTDTNHIPSLILDHEDGSLLYVVREDGSFDTRPSNVFAKHEMHCDETFLSNHYNF